MHRVLVLSVRWRKRLDVNIKTIEQCSIYLHVHMQPNTHAYSRTQDEGVCDLHPEQDQREHMHAAVQLDGPVELWVLPARQCGGVYYVLRADDRGANAIGHPPVDQGARLI